MTTLVPPDALPPSPAPGPEPRTSLGGRLGSLPRSIRYTLVALAGVLLFSFVREITGAQPLTGDSTFRSALQLAMPIALAGLGGLWAERAGVINIGLEGMMIVGTWFGAWAGIEFGAWEGVLVGTFAGAMAGLLLAVTTVTFGVDHIVAGVAITLLADGTTRFLTNIAYEGSDKASPTVPDVVATFDVPVVSSLAHDLGEQNRFFLSDLSRIAEGLTTDVSLLVVLGVALFPFTFWVLWRTAFGLRLRSVGEDPVAAESLGIKVYSLKYVAVTISGALSGLGGVALVYMFAKQFQVNQTNGRGFIGLAAMIFGNWRPGGLALGAGLFGFTDSLQSQTDETAHAVLLFVAILLALLALRAALQHRRKAAIGMALAAAGVLTWNLTTNEVAVEIIPFLPHLTTLVVLAFASQRLRPPAADGRIYRRGEGV